MSKLCSTLLCQLYPTVKIGSKSIKTYFQTVLRYMLWPYILTNVQFMVVKIKFNVFLV